MERVMKYLNRVICDYTIKYGEIECRVNAFAFREITFRVDARNVRVDWGDHEKSDEMTTTCLFRHFYR